MAMPVWAHNQSDIKTNGGLQMSLPKKTEAAMWPQVQDQLERYLEVERLLAFTDGPGSRLPEGLKREVASLEEVEDTAEKLRRAWGLGLDPISNLVEALEDRGIRIVTVEVDQKFDACLVLTNDEIPVIVVNSTHPGDRQRLSISHELGRLVLRPADTLDGEKAAFRFAGAFLVPSQVVREELGERRQRINLYELHLLKHKYGISMQAWLYRAMELGILPGPVAEHHLREFRTRGWHTAEPGDQLPPEVSTRFNRLVMQALEEGVISEARAAELLGKPLARLVEEIAKEHNGLPLTMYN